MSDCPVCGKMRATDKDKTVFYCRYCAVFHYPKKCEGADCKICEAIKVKVKS